MAGPGYPRQRGTLTARVVVPEIDGGTLPLCIATQNENKHGYYLYTAENERIDAVVDHITKYMSLRDMSNKEKARCYLLLQDSGKRRPAGKRYGSDSFTL